MVQICGVVRLQCMYCLKRNFCLIGVCGPRAGSTTSAQKTVVRMRPRTCEYADALLHAQFQQRVVDPQDAHLASEDMANTVGKMVEWAIASELSCQLTRSHYSTNE
jgi:hypothetical protein